jgi:hypothetical protein
MTGERPNFLDSPYFYADKDGWHLKPGAPDDIVKEFNAYMEQQAQAEDAGLGNAYQEGSV